MEQMKQGLRNATTTFQRTGMQNEETRRAYTDFSLGVDQKLSELSDVNTRLKMLEEYIHKRNIDEVR